MRLRTAKNAKDLPGHLEAARAAVAQAHNHRGDTGAGVLACLDAPDTGGAASSSGPDAPCRFKKLEMLNLPSISL